MPPNKFTGDDDGKLETDFIPISIVDGESIVGRRGLRILVFHGGHDAGLSYPSFG